jgi:hypothetical protein
LGSTNITRKDRLPVAILSIPTNRAQNHSYCSSFTTLSRTKVPTENRKRISSRVSLSLSNIASRRVYYRRISS